MAEDLNTNCIRPAPPGAYSPALTPKSFDVMPAPRPSMMRRIEALEASVESLHKGLCALEERQGQFEAETREHFRQLQAQLGIEDI